ncbi:hypothetical protein ID866_4460 [Astraeus odoratus]|nr:hypothetical protein ID866_4460 [Astraeus odoratus]
MADSIPASWICNYLIDIAENHGGQLSNAPFFSKKKRVQLIDFLTFYEDSYVWAWASDKSHRIPIRISKEGVQEYKVQSHGRNVIDCRFAVVFISNFRPIFAPRPLGGTLKGNTTVSHIALEVGHVGVIGHGGHMFGDPKDVESNAPVKEWVAGLRQDGGGGNILKLRKQERQAAVQQTSAPTRLCQPTSPKLDSVLAATATKPVANEQLQAPACPQRPVDFKREYKKRHSRLIVGSSPVDRSKKPRQSREQDCPQPLKSVQKISTPSHDLLPAHHLLGRQNHPTVKEHPPNGLYHPSKALYNKSDPVLRHLMM